MLMQIKHAQPTTGPVPTSLQAEGGWVDKQCVSTFPVLNASMHRPTKRMHTLKVSAASACSSLSSSMPLAEVNTGILGQHKTPPGNNQHLIKQQEQAMHLSQSHALLNKSPGSIRSGLRYQLLSNRHQAN
jgi:hypothetical protein